MLVTNTYLNCTKHACYKQYNVSLSTVPPGDLEVGAMATLSRKQFVSCGRYLSASFRMPDFVFFGKCFISMYSKVNKVTGRSPSCCYW